MATTINTYDVSQVTWNADAVEPQLCQPTITKTANLKASTTFRRGELLASTTAAPTVFLVFAPAGADGSEVFRGIMPRACVTDSNGNVFEGAQASGEFPGVFLANVPVYLSGVFRQADLPGLDATAWAQVLVSIPAARILSGTIAGGNALIKF